MVLTHSQVNDKNQYKHGKAKGITCLDASHYVIFTSERDTRTFRTSVNTREKSADKSKNSRTMLKRRRMSFGWEHPPEWCVLEFEFIFIAIAIYVNNRFGSYSHFTRHEATWLVGNESDCPFADSQYAFGFWSFSVHLSSVLVRVGESSDRNDSMRNCETRLPSRGFNMEI